MGMLCRLYIKANRSIAGNAAHVFYRQTRTFSARNSSTPRGRVHQDSCDDALTGPFMSGYPKVTLLPIEQLLKSPPQEDLFHLSMLRNVNGFPSCREGFFSVKK